MFERMQQCMMTLVEACIESQGGLTLLAITKKLNVPKHMMVWTLLLF
jgi:hypothetical protein